ncbi:MAG: hypothetical protein Q7T56_08795 [Nocardioidaceae bacterium]|nr:hypothetical protein [Nocardioidaceae bacterium]
MTVAAFVVSVLSGLIAGVSALVAVSARKAARDSANEAKRANDRNERLDREAAERDAAERERKAVRWTIDPLSGSEWELRHRGHRRATNVTLRGSSDQIVAGAPTGVDLEPDHRVSFTIFTPWDGSFPATLRVTWDGNPDGVDVPVQRSATPRA